jgi:hypothetical protein
MDGPPAQGREGSLLLPHIAAAFRQRHRVTACASTSDVDSGGGPVTVRVIRTGEKFVIARAVVGVCA